MNTIGRLKIIGIMMFAFTLFAGCEGKFEKVEEDRFVGEWELQGRGILDGMNIKIDTDNDKLVGRISKLNDNKYVLMFSEIGDIWITEISRTSKFQFELTEKKIAGQLFSMYDISTSTEFKVEFTDNNTFGISAKNQDPSKSKALYKRIE